jgi:hypothetical protein
LPDLLRRVAALTVVSAIGIALLAPLTARSALPQGSETARLLDVAEQPVSTLDRGTAAGRERSALLTLQQLARPIQAESLGASAPLPTPATVDMEPTLHLNPTPRPTPTPPPVIVPPPPSGDTVSGKATWYCCTSGWTGQAVVALPGALGGQYDPPPAARYVTVCADRCVELPVVDYCGCYWGTSDQRVADLSPEAWAAVSDTARSAGIISVTVHL